MILNQKDRNTYLEYPRPDFQRDYQSLDGIWKFKLCRTSLQTKRIIQKYLENSEATADDWKEIKVPFCIESKESGIEKRLHKILALYYRTFDIDELSEKNIYHIHAGAIDHTCEIFINGTPVGNNSGGYTPLQVSLEGNHLKPKGNTILISVKDSLAKDRLRGKQAFTRKNKFVHYTPVSGIWQSVWLEKTGTCYIKNYKIYPGLKSFTIEIFFSEPPEDMTCTFSFSKKKVTLKKEDFIIIRSGLCARADIQFSSYKIKPELWSPDNPEVIPAVLSVFSKNKRKPSDTVKTFFGIRTVERRGGSIYLNNSKIYQKLILNQGYYPDGWYRPVAKDEYARDIQLIKDAGFNGMRIHEKIEDPAFLFLCDAMGMIVWEEIPSPYIYNKKSHNETEAALKSVIDRDFNHPSILVWVIFNESWGLYNILPFKKFKNVLNYFFALTKQLDSTRLTIDNSGFFHTATDIIDIHHYIPDKNDIEKYYDELSKRKFEHFNFFKFIEIFRHIEAAQPPFREKTFNDAGQPLIISEFGGFGFYETENVNFLELYRQWISQIKKHSEIQGFCYTQFTDVEQEQNGLFTFERNKKFSVSQLNKINGL